MRAQLFDLIRPWLDERGFTRDRIDALDAALDTLGIEREPITVVGRKEGRRINAAGFKLIKEFEGCRLQAYQDIVGVWTVGYGSTGSHVHPGLTLTEAECEALLLKDLERFEAAVAKEAPNATDNQFAAFVSFAFNVGEAGFRKSTALVRHKAGRHQEAADALLLWNKAGGRVVAGLTRRRQAERKLYLTP